MTKLKKEFELATAFNSYAITEILGEGGAGRVYGGQDETGAEIAIKVLSNTSSDKKRRFKNEIGFLSKTQHQNIVRVTDHGLAAHDKVSGPFYVMPRFAGSLRGLLDKRIASDEVMPWFSQILDGVEAAHLHGVTHRDLKPENVLVSADRRTLAIADFGVASFTQEQLHTFVETQPTQRLANFQYAAPEQRTPGQKVGATADIYALGMILNEMFTGEVPHGTDFQTIASVSEEHGYLDAIVEQMLRNNPTNRPASIGSVKQLIQKHHAEAVSLQKLSALDEMVIPAGEVDDLLAHQPPTLIGANWQDGQLTLTLDRRVNQGWEEALKNMGSYSAVMGKGPAVFNFSGETVRVHAAEHEAQSIIDHFKNWLPVATRVYKHRLEEHIKRAEAERIEQLRRERANEERNLKLNQSLRI